MTHSCVTRTHTRTRTHTHVHAHTRRCVSDDAVPASLRCAAIVVGKRLFLFPKGRDGMCDLQFAMVQCVAVCRVAVCCSVLVLQCAAVTACVTFSLPWSELQCVAVCSSVSVLQCAAAMACAHFSLR